jgi:hypothetical protein
MAFLPWPSLCTDPAPSLAHHQRFRLAMSSTVLLLPQCTRTISLTSPFPRASEMAFMPRLVIMRVKVRKWEEGVRG